MVFSKTGILSQSNVFSIANQAFLSLEWEMKLRVADGVWGGGVAPSILGIELEVGGGVARRSSNRKGIETPVEEGPAPDPPPHDPLSQPHTPSIPRPYIALIPCPYCLITPSSKRPLISPSSNPFNSHFPVASLLTSQPFIPSIPYSLIHFCPLPLAPPSLQSYTTR